MHSTMRQEVPDYHRHQRPVHHPHPAHDHGVNGAAGAAASKTVYGDGSWQLSIFVTDLQVEKSLRVRGDLHIGGVMIKLVDSLGELIRSNCFLVIKQQQNTYFFKSEYESRSERISCGHGQYFKAIIFTVRKLQRKLKG